MELIAATGCISIAVSGPRGAVTIDRVIEYSQLTVKNCTIWIDVFFTNTSDESREMFVLHRGAFKGVDVTHRSWSFEPEFDGTFERALTDRIQKLHHRYAPIDVDRDGTVRLDGVEYTFSKNRGEPNLTSVVPNRQRTDVPFTLWNVGRTTPRERSVFRLRLQMLPPTFAAGIGKHRRFVAFGESILLAKIQDQDIPAYRGADRDLYIGALRNFLSEDHVIPDTFEYLVVSPDGTELPWETTPLSPGLAQPAIEYPHLENCTRWFVPNDSANFVLTGKAYTSFALSVTAADKIPGYVPVAVH